jgi:hypothetical protein
MGICEIGVKKIMKKKRKPLLDTLEKKQPFRREDIANALHCLVYQIGELGRLTPREEEDFYDLIYILREGELEL